MAGTSATLVRDAWNRIDAWCQRHVPGMMSDLNPGASSTEISELENVISQQLPDDVRESLSIHNGEDFPRRGFIFGLGLLGTHWIAMEWEGWAELTTYNDEYRDNMNSVPPNAIELDYANLGWIPLTRDGGGNHLGVDLSPGSAGTKGQVINFGRDEKRKCVLANSWGEFLRSYALFLESGALKGVDPDPEVWGENFESVLQIVTEKGECRIQHAHDGLVRWKGEGRWPLS